MEEASTVNPRATSHGPSPPSTVQILTHPFISQSHLTLLQTHFYEGAGFGIIQYPALYGATLSAETPQSVRPVHSSSLSEAEDADVLKGGIRLARFVLSHRMPKRFSAWPTCCLDESMSCSSKSAHCKNTTQSRSRRLARLLR